MCALWSPDAPITESLCLHALAPSRSAPVHELAAPCATRATYPCDLHDGHVAAAATHRCHRDKLAINFPQRPPAMKGQKHMDTEITLHLKFCLSPRTWHQ